MSRFMAIATAQCEYAICALVELAMESPGASIRSPDLATRLGVPVASMEQVMVRLRRHGFVRSFRGSTGGYALARAPESITVGEVLATFLSTLEGGRPSVAEIPTRQAVRDALQQLEVAFSASADRLTLGQLVEDCRQRDDALALMPGL
jgi:Rrf2 family protein